MTANTLNADCKLPPSDMGEAFLRSIVVENCQSSCEVVAAQLEETSGEHEVFNDFIAACSEYSTAVARDSRHRSRYAAWTAERCNETAEVCDRIGDAQARRCARWCRLLMQELNREISWDGVKKVMNTEVSWGGVKKVLNTEIRLPWGG
ncbi:MAG: hypothetical protein Q7Q71_15475 [Verrucomicrobiota bacterium JB023]|nr:hypothetical protein [Verrucomicrobiota bacterium JB023]